MMYVEDDPNLVYGAEFGHQPTAVFGYLYRGDYMPDTFKVEVRQPCGASIVVYNHDIDALVEALMRVQQKLRMAR